MKQAILSGALALILAAPAIAQSPHLTPFVENLRGVGPGGIPVAVPDGTRSYLHGQVTADHYSIDINEFQDRLHPEMPGLTTLWGYNPRNALGESKVPVQKHLGGILVTHRGRPVQITFHNNLPNKPHILPVDTTIMGSEAGVPQNRTCVHLHGGSVPWISDGGPYAWWDPQGDKGPSFLNNQVLRPNENVPKDEAEYYYPNNQSPLGMVSRPLARDYAIERLRRCGLGLRHSRRFRAEVPGGPDGVAQVCRKRRTRTTHHDPRQGLHRREGSLLPRPSEGRGLPVVPVFL